MKKFMDSYPVVIDPAVRVLEVHTAAEVDGTGRWQQLQRLRVSPSRLPFTLTNNVAHLFGERPHLADCNLILCYSTRGRLTETWQQVDGDWQRCELPEEFCGLSVKHKSIRFTFADDVDCDHFQALLAKMHGAVRALSRPDPRDAFALIAIIARAPQPAQIIPIEVEYDEADLP